MKNDKVLTIFTTISLSERVEAPLVTIDQFSVHTNGVYIVNSYLQTLQEYFESTKMSSLQNYLRHAMAHPLCLYS